MYKYYFDLVAIIIFAIILYTTSINKMYKVRSTRILMLMSIFGILACTFAVLFVKVNAFDKLSLIFTTIYIILRNLVILLYLGYILVSLRFVFIRKRILLYILFSIPYFLLSFCLIFNIFHPFIIDVSNHETVLLDYFYLLVCLTAYYLVCAIALIFLHKASFNIKKLWFIIFDLLIITVAMVIQMIFSSWFIEMISIAISILLLMLSIERAEKIIDPGSESLKNDAFKTDMKVDYYYKKSEYILLIYFKSFESFSQILPSSKLEELKKEITRYIRYVARKTKLKIDLYYIKEGRYAILVDDKEKNINDFVEFFNIYIDNELYFKFYDYKLDPNIILVKTIDDFNNLESLLDFSYKFEKYIPFVDTTYLNYSNLSDKEIIKLKTNMPKKIIEAINNNSFEVFYQPIYNLEDNTFETAEALIRLNDGGAFISPEIFIPIAEEIGSIDKIGEIVFKEVCMFIKSKEFLNLNLKYIEVNVSPKQIINKNFAQNFINIAKCFEIDPKQIYLEITESASFINYDVVNNNVNDLKEFGFRFALDDYGTGYSNIKRILKMPLDIIKIDKTIVDEIKVNDDMKVIIENLIEAFKTVGFEILVEGIETKETLDYFKNHSCKYIQGFYFSKPLCKVDFIEFILNNLKSTN